MRWTIGAAAMVAMTSSAMAQDQAKYERAVEAVETRLHAVDELGTYPGRAVVMVRRGETPVVDVIGRTRADGGEAASAETPFYIASMTKAFVGLMAVRLDEMGVMPLDTSLGKTFPDMKVEGLDVDALTMRELLSHQLGFRAPPLNIRTAYTDLVPVDDYAAIVTASGEANGEAFRYDNLGYLLYAAALEQKTGKSWRNWIDDIVFDPLGMTQSSARTSDFREVSHIHEEYEEGWRTYPPKTDAIMHAAGGLVISANDMARWLAANAGQPSAISQTIFDAAQSSQVVFDMSQGPMKCTGYAFGWRRCEAFGLKFLEHGGGYTGTRSEMVVLPEEGIAFAAMFNSDSMTGGLSGQLMQTFITAYAGGEVPPVAAFAESYAKDAAEYRANRSRREQEHLAEATGWRPDLETLAAIGGTYTHPATGNLSLSVRSGELVGDLNGTPVFLRPMKENTFDAWMATDPTVETFEIVRDDGVVTHVVYSGVNFDRAD